MCGRYTIKTGAKQIQAELGLDEPPLLAPRYNVAPTQAAPIVTALEPRKLTVAQWGLIPHWAHDATGAGKMINARSETVMDKPAFKEAFRRRRCLVVADGFYEWKPAGKVSQPFYIQLQSQRPFTLAGLWELWHAPNGLDVVSFTILTRPAEGFMATLHDRMPVFVSRADRARWLSPTEDAAELQPLLQSVPAEPLGGYEVDTRVNSAGVDDERCLAPARQVQLSLL